MPPISASELLQIWERGLVQTPADRALELLAAALPDSPRESLASRSLGARTRELLRLRERLFGRQMAAVAACPRCAERLEISLDAAEMRSDSERAREGELALSVAGYDVSSRPPSTADVIESAQELDLSAARALVLRRCVLSAHRGSEPVEPGQLPPDVVEAVVQSMADADPLADIQIVLSCPACGHGWRAAFDVVSFLWTEIEAWAWRVLSDVHTLASTYGWRERDILDLSPTRRQFYLEMVGA